MGPARQLRKRLRNDRESLDVVDVMLDKKQKHSEKCKKNKLKNTVLNFNMSTTGGPVSTFSSAGARLAPSPVSYATV